MLLSMLLPGLGHAWLGRPRTAVLVLLGFVAAAGTAVLAAEGRPPDLGMSDTLLFFNLAGSALAIWFFAMIDAWLIAREAPSEARNPRVALLLNLCTRGLGYFYLDLPWVGAACIVAFALLGRLPDDGTALAATLALQVGIALHGYHVAARQRPAGAWNPLAPARALAAVALVAGAALLGLGAVSAGADQVASTEVAPVRQAARTVQLPAVGLSFTLPASDWTLENDAQSPLPCVRSPRARLLLLRSRGPEGLGLDGYLCELAGQMSGQYGEVRLRNQRELSTPSGPVREICFEWTENGQHAFSHVFLIAQGDEVYTFLVAFPARIEGSARAEIERLLSSVRFTE